MRKVDGWQSLAEKPDNQIIDLAARSRSIMPTEDASQNYNATPVRTGGDRGSRRNQMAIAQKLLQNIATLNELIEMEWDDVASNPLREEERKNICLQIENCRAELQNLLERLSDNQN
jgi:hypothetical protein